MTDLEKNPGTLLTDGQNELGKEVLCCKTKDDGTSAAGDGKCLKVFSIHVILMTLKEELELK